MHYRFKTEQELLDEGQDIYTGNFAKYPWIFNKDVVIHPEHRKWIKEMGSFFVDATIVNPPVVHALNRYGAGCVIFRLSRLVELEITLEF